jgi:hypothetical protein
LERGFPPSRFKEQLGVAERAGDFASQNALVLRILQQVKKAESVEGNLGLPSEQENFDY